MRPALIDKSFRQSCGPDDRPFGRIYRCDGSVSTTISHTPVLSHLPFQCRGVQAAHLVVIVGMATLKEARPARAQTAHLVAFECVVSRFTPH
jgi:hypothetical protein